MKTAPLLARSTFAAVIAADLRSTTRDPTLVFAALVSFVPAPLIWYWRAEIDGLGRNTLSLSGLSDYAGAVALVLPALLIGWVVGFLMLEERDDGALQAIEVSPPGKSGLLFYRLATATLITFLVTLISGVLIFPSIPFILRVFLSLLIALEAAAIVVILPTLARNKVEGLALTKVLNIFSLAPLLALLPLPWRYIGAIVPSYWIGDLLGLGAGGLPIAVSATLALMVHLIAVAFLLSLFVRRG